jgi:pimeloyl-ACP methyl ester carboxylesterase
MSALGSLAPSLATAFTSLFVLALASVAVVGGGLALITLRTARRVEAALPPAGDFVEVPGARLHVVERGRGPALLLVHGLAGQLGNFTYGVVDRLADSFRVVAVDRPGSGYSVRAKGASAGLIEQADALAALIDRRGLGRPLVVGHSLGGALALALAQRHPAKVSGLALVAPLTQVVPTIPPAFRGLMIAAPWLQSLVAWTLATPVGIARREELMAMIFGPEPVPADFATRGGGLLSLRPSHFISACADLVALADDLPRISAGYSAMHLPVSVLYGRQDGILDPRVQGESLAAVLPGASLELVEGGHMLPVTAPDRTTRFIREAAARAQAAPVS